MAGKSSDLTGDDMGTWGGRERDSNSNPAVAGCARERKEREVGGRHGRAT